MTVPHAEKLLVKALSPNRHYQVVRISVAGGGDKPFCYDSVSVMLAVYPEMFADKGRSYEVFNAPCDKDRQNWPKAEWVSDTEMKVTFHPTSAKDPRKRRFDVTQGVKILFDEQK